MEKNLFLKGEKLLKMDKNINMISQISNEFFKNKIIKNNNFKNKYYFWQIIENWEKIVDKLMCEKSEVKNFYGKKLTINVNDSNVHHILKVYQGNLIRKINDFFQDEIVNELEIKFINAPINTNKKINRNTKVFENKYYLEKDNLIELELPKNTIKKIDEDMKKIDKKYENLKTEMREIAVNFVKKREYFLLKGYKKCQNCEKLFNPKTNENRNICIGCVNELENKKIEKMISLVKNNPFISEFEALKLVNVDSYIYYRVRDILSQEIYNEIIYLVEKTNINMEENQEYKEEYKKESKLDFEILVKLYIDYKVGTEDKSTFEHLKNKLIKKIKREINFKKLNKR